VDSRLRRSPPDRASAVSYGQAGENAMRFPHLAHRSAAAHKLHSTTATTRYEFDSGKGETFSRNTSFSLFSRKLSKQPEPSQFDEQLVEYLKEIEAHVFRANGLHDMIVANDLSTDKDKATASRELEGHISCLASRATLLQKNSVHRSN